MSTPLDLLPTKGIAQCIARFWREQVKPKNAKKSSRKHDDDFKGHSHQYYIKSRKVNLKCRRLLHRRIPEQGQMENPLAQSINMFPFIGSRCNAT